MWRDRPSQVTSWLLLDLVASLPYFWLVCDPMGRGACTPRDATEEILLPVTTLLCVLRLTRIARAEGARVLLLLGERRRRVRYRHGGETAMLRLAMLFLWLAHAAGCLYWYTCVLELRDGVEGHLLSDGLTGGGTSSSALGGAAAIKGPGIITWGGEGIYGEWLPPVRYASYYAPGMPKLASLLANRTALASGTSVTADAAAGDLRGAVTLGEVYLLSLVWGLLHVSGIGFEKPGSPRGVACAAIVSIAAIATNATLIGSVTTTLTRITAYRGKEQTSRELVTAFLTDHQVPARLQKSIHDYYDFAGGVTRSRRLLLPSLPRVLSFQLEIFLKRAIFLRVPFLEDASSQHTPELEPRTACHEFSY